jgi:hypothetical protein
MLKHFCVMAALATMIAPAAADVINLRGTIKFVAKNSDCGSGVKLSVEQRSRYHPGKTIAPEQNGNWTGLNMVGDFVATAWGGNVNDFTTTFQKVAVATLTDTFRGTTPDLDLSASKTFVRLKVLPPTITSSTVAVTISGQIKNPFAKSTQVNCIVDFLAAYINRG